MTLLADEFMTVASMGDSRIYRLRKATLLQLTRDHNVAAELAARGHLSLSQVARSALRGTLSRALGVSSSSDVDIEHHPLESGDRLMLCSDGLTKAIHDPKLQRSWQVPAPLERPRVLPSRWRIDAEVATTYRASS